MSPCRQLILIIELYNHYDVYDYLRQIALTLCSDKVSEVRWISYKLVSERRCSGLLSKHRAAITENRRGCGGVFVTCVYIDLVQFLMLLQSSLLVWHR